MPRPARAWLDEADALAARGLYAEAVHHLLFRSVEDIQRAARTLVRPSLTSRELAAASGIPTIARELFARIAGYVERSLFGGRPVVADDWMQGARRLCRLRAARAVEGMSDVAIIAQAAARRRAVPAAHDHPAGVRSASPRSPRC